MKLCSLPIFSATTRTWEQKPPLSRKDLQVLSHDIFYCVTSIKLSEAEVCICKFYDLIMWQYDFHPPPYIFKLIGRKLQWQLALDKAYGQFSSDGLIFPSAGKDTTEDLFLFLRRISEMSFVTTAMNLPQGDYSLQTDDILPSDRWL